MSRYSQTGSIRLIPLDVFPVLWCVYSREREREMTIRAVSQRCPVSARRGRQNRHGGCMELSVNGMYEPLGMGTVLCPASQ